MLTASIIIGSLLILFVGMQLIMLARMKKNKGKTAPAMSGEIGRAIKNGNTALIYFYSPGCRACKPMTPVVQAMAQKRDNVFPVDISKDMQTAQKFGIMGTPATLIIEQGIIKEILIGAQPAGKLEALASP